MPRTLFMETTKIPASKTAMEIHEVLVKSGAEIISTSHKDGQISGMSWTMKVGQTVTSFSMPVRVMPVFMILKSRRSQRIGEAALKEMMEQAERVAWRQLLRWIVAQNAMIEIGMMKPAEPFLPYAEIETGVTMFECFERSQLTIAAPAPKR